MTLVGTLPHSLEANVLVRATRETVFQFFTDNDRWSAWWGPGSTIDPRPGGRVVIRHANGVEAWGEVVEVRPPTRIVFTYGYATGEPFAPGASRVSIDLSEEAGDTRVQLMHAFDNPKVRDEHVQGWRYQLSVFANAVADVSFGGAAGTVDAWLSAWSEPDAGSRERTLARIAMPDVRFRDRFSAIEGATNVSAHFAAGQRFMPGLRLQREGDVRHCQGVALADWTARTPEGQVRAAGTNLFVLVADGRIESVTGFWSRHPGQ